MGFTDEECDWEREYGFWVMGLLGDGKEVVRGGLEWSLVRVQH